MTQPTEKFLRRLTSSKPFYGTDTCLFPSVYATFRDPNQFKIIDAFLMITIRRAVGDYGDGRLKVYYKNDPETNKPIVDEKHIKLTSEETHRIINILKVILNHGNNFKNVMNALESRTGLNQFKVVTNPQTKEILKLNYNFFRPNKENEDKSQAYNFVVSILPPNDKFPSCGVSMGFVPNDMKLPSYTFTTRDVSRISLLISTLENMDEIARNTVGNTPMRKYYEDWFNNIYQKAEKKIIDVKEVATPQGEQEQVPILETPEEELDFEKEQFALPSEEETTEVDVESFKLEKPQQSYEEKKSPTHGYVSDKFKPSGKRFTPPKPTSFNK